MFACVSRADFFFFFGGGIDARGLWKCLGWGECGFFRHEGVLVRYCYRKMRNL